MNLNERIEAGRTNEVAKSFQAASEMIEKLETGEMPIAWLSGPGGCGKTHAARGAIKAFEQRGLAPIYCNPSNYKDVLDAIGSAKVYKGKTLIGKRLIVMEEADVIFRSDKCLNLLKIVTDRAGTGHYDGVDVRVPIMVTTNAPLADLAATDKARGEHLRALFNRVPPMTISYDRQANYDYAVSLALTTDLLRFTPGKQQISRATVALTLEKFTAEFNRIELLTARTLSNIAEYYTSFTPETAQTMVERLLLPNGFRHRLPSPPVSDWAALVDEAVERKRAIRTGVDWEPSLSPKKTAPATPKAQSIIAASAKSTCADEPYWVDLDEIKPLFQWGNKIGWTGKTLNCIVGCSKVSRACKNCYATAIVARGLHPMHEGVARWDRGKALWSGEVRYDRNILKDRPRNWGNKASLVFFTSLSDPFHERLSVDTIQEMLDGCAAYPQHIFQWLTKRPERAAALADSLRWPPNIWIGATIEEDKETWRADELRKIPVATKFISAEPLTVDAMPSLDLTDISWLIVGGESGNNVDPMDIDWARSLRDRAVKAGTAFFFKQWGKYGPDGKRHDRKHGLNDVLLDGRVWHQFPRAALHHGVEFDGYKAP
ncbi:DUF5131 family protein, partial [Sphingobium fuliginis]|uniref:DUF5131 family protein n=1 Tax=Sphingobium fuliginis (strain ATCC 27551) TaxID=336203 RepID=UPI0037CBA331